jgi:cell division septal protein FtsQ
MFQGGERSMSNKKDDEAKSEKTKAVYDFESDKSKGLFEGVNAKGLTDKDIENALNRSLEKNVDDETEDDEEEEEQGGLFGKILKTLFAAVILAVIGLAIWAVNSSFFYISHVYINDGTRVSSGDLMPIFSGDIGTNIFLVNTESLKFRVRQNPYISDVTIKKEYPDTLIVSFTERTPNSLIKDPSGDLIVDKSGYILKPEDGEGYDNLLVMNSFLSKDYLVGETLSRN